MPDREADYRIEDYIHADINLGDEADDWLKTPVGQYIVGRCDAQLAEAINQLLVVDPYDGKKIQELQNHGMQAFLFITWINELLQKRDEHLRQAHEESQTLTQE